MDHDPVRFRRGDFREDGRIFWQYDGLRERWVTPEKYEELRARRKAYMAEFTSTYYRDPAYHEREKTRRARDSRRSYLRDYARQYEKTDKFRAHKRNYEIARYANDPTYRLKRIVRAATYRSSRLAGGSRSSSSFEILGTDLKTFKSHIESLFTEGMGWEKMGKEIHIDHIVPLSSGATPEEILKLAHYTNLQPLWAGDNLRKGAKVLKEIS